MVNEWFVLVKLTVRFTSKVKGKNCSTKGKIFHIKQKNSLHRQKTIEIRKETIEI